ncbi:hypothetical protein [Leifsonia virtsii]|uniref:Secreted protein n=1 Tax=Leifsonia virtsii TaxID=3035915 RepID=A0ABT8IX77_9MICO|nr:hypothetical protein [Leifsonia virtsii]MDN4596624.1 hypothetical protein [Leifsonia virtsii]
MIHRITRASVRSAISLAIVTFVSSTGVAVANAADAPADNEATFQEFVEGMGVDSASATVLTAKFDELPAAEQERLADVIETDPLSVLDFQDDGAAPTIAPAGGGLSVQAYATASKYTATYPVNATLFGITTGTFNLRYTFEATSNAVTRNLECTGWFTGTAGVWTVDSRSSQYISSGVGTCTVTHKMSLLYKGSSFTANKQQQLNYRGTTLVSGGLKNI